MPQTIKKYHYIFIYLFVLFLTKNTYGNNIPDSLFKSGNYERAALEYERIIFHSEDLNEINLMHYKKAQCYKQLNKYTLASNELNQIIYLNLTDSISEQYRLEYALCLYLNSSFPESEFQLEIVENKTSKILNPAKLFLLKSLVNSETSQWESALFYGKKYINLEYPNNIRDSLNNLIELTFQPNNLPKYKSEKKANVFRMLPGLGQAYTGRIGEGAFNFLLNLSFLSFGVYHIYYGYYITGYFVGAIGISKVYFGGHYRTAKLLAKHNYIVHRKFCDNVKSILLNNKRPAKS